MTLSHWVMSHVIATPVGRYAKQS